MSPREVRNHDEAFRAVVTRVSTNHTTREVKQSPATYLGPYATKGAATAAISRERRWPGWSPSGTSIDVVGHVERAVTNWERVD